MLKIIGAFFIIACSAFFGIYFGKKEDRRIRTLENIKSALLIIKSEINFSLSSLCEAVHIAGEKVESPVSIVFMSFYEKLFSKSGEDVGKMWRDSIIRATDFLNIKTDDIERLLMLSNTFCSADKERCIRGIEAMINYIEQKNQELSKERVRSLKLYPSLCIFSGLILVIFLI